MGCPEVPGFQLESHGSPDLGVLWVSRCLTGTWEEEREGLGDGVDVMVHWKGWCMGVWVRIAGEGRDGCRESVRMSEEEPWEVAIKGTNQQYS